MFIDKINVVEWFHLKSPSWARCKEGDLPLLNFSNLKCMYCCLCGAVIKTVIVSLCLRPD